MSETKDYLVGIREDAIVVDFSRHQFMPIFFDIVFPGMSCAEAMIDAVDDSGEPHPRAVADIKKTRIGKQGEMIAQHSAALGKHNTTKVCMNCYGHETGIWARIASYKCCSCDEVKKAYAEKGFDVNKAGAHALCIAQGSIEAGLDGEGCQISGNIIVPRAKGNLHVAAGHSGNQRHGGHAHHVHQINPNQLKQLQETYKVQHVIRKLRFGADFPGQSNPLEGVALWEPGLLRHLYMIQVVPTRYERSILTVDSNQYTFSNYTEKVDVSTSHWHLPGVFFKYDFSPMMVVVSDRGGGFSHYITRLFALLGGTYVVLGMLYNIISKFCMTVQKKIR